MKLLVWPLPATRIEPSACRVLLRVLWHSKALDHIVLLDVRYDWLERTTLPLLGRLEERLHRKYRLAPKRIAPREALSNLLSYSLVLPNRLRRSFWKSIFSVIVEFFVQHHPMEPKRGFRQILRNAGAGLEHFSQIELRRWTSAFRG